MYQLEKLEITCENPEDVKVWCEEVSLNVPVDRSKEANLWTWSCRYI